MEQGYSGCATGKAKQAAKTEIEKLKLHDMDIDGLITEAGKMYVFIRSFAHLWFIRRMFENVFLFYLNSIYQVHDELKDKLFKMELSWVCELSDGIHQTVPQEWYSKALTAGIEAKRDDDSDNEI